MATFYFVDTRENAKSNEPFGINNPDVAKSWTYDFNNGEGPFKPVKDGDVKVQDAPKQEEPQIESTVYDDMTNDELKAELEARVIDFKSKATKTELIALLVANDNE